ncbi:hypothetical protein [Rudaeicoccus suwonensis]|uniref:Uncharacterized protein n=1 Tax=Rudaeicoccus suwonensis TaxID=657409 RepID=A0A561E4F3_9MICO|nr:hypothetical protein [Rudaeicoccus suwonensis]TWE10497.1 hypothetical protein BKA23_2863 [Rudaeicoccus suwonensis]
MDNRENGDNNVAEKYFPAHRDIDYLDDYTPQPDDIGPTNDTADNSPPSDSKADSLTDADSEVRTDRTSPIHHLDDCVDPSSEPETLMARPNSSETDTDRSILRDTTIDPERGEAISATESKLSDPLEQGPSRSAIDDQRVMDEEPTTAIANRFDSKNLGPATEAEFQDSTDAAQLDQNDPPEMPPDAHTPKEQRVINDAKAALARRENGGDVLGGNPVSRADQWHQQGRNEKGYENDCGLASVAAMAREFGVNVTEGAVVDRAAAAGLCDTSHKDEVLPDGTMDANKLNGGTTGQNRHELLQSYGIENTIEYPQSPEELAEYVEAGRGVITALDATEMWRLSPFESPICYDADGRSGTNHAVQVTGTVRDKSSGELTGFVINDTGRDDGAGNVIPIDLWHACWTNTRKEHETVVTTQPARPYPRDFIGRP